MNLFSPNEIFLYVKLLIYCKQKNIIFVNIFVDTLKYYELRNWCIY